MQPTDRLETAMERLTNVLLQHASFTSGTESPSSQPFGGQSFGAPADVVPKQSAEAYDAGQTARGPRPRTPPSMPPNERQDDPKPTPSIGTLGQLAKDDPGNRLNPKTWMRSLAQFAPAVPNASTQGQVTSDTSTPPNGTVTAPPGSPLATHAQANMMGGLNESDQNVMTMAMLGEHGAPPIVRNTVMGMYGMKRSIDWAQAGANAVQNNMPGWVPKPIAGAAQAAAPSVAGALSIAQAHPFATYAGIKGVQAIGGVVGNINDHLSTMRTIGQSFGYGAGGATGAPAMAGIADPTANLGPAARVGMAFDVERHALEGQVPGQGFGKGLTKDQSQSALDVIANQGFSMNPLGSRTGLLTPSGNAATIAQGLFRPLMQQMPGLKADEIGQFTSSLRNAGSTTEQVRDELSTLGKMALATSENVNTLASATKTAGDSFASMGSTELGGQQAATAFQQTTGIQGGVTAAGEMAKVPIVQGMALSQGVLPSGMGDMNPGASASNMTQTVKMLANMYQGLNHDTYQMVNGVRTKVSDGKKAMYDQISAHLNGAMTSNQIQAALDPAAQPGTAARQNIKTVMGGSTGTAGTGLWADVAKTGDHLNTQQMAKFNQNWKTGIDQHLANTGLTPAAMAKVDRIKDPKSRLQALNTAMANSSQTPNNTVGKDAQTVKVEFTTAAAKYFQTVGSGNTPGKNNANAGRGSYNDILNQVGGDPNKVHGSTYGLYWK